MSRRDQHIAVAAAAVVDVPVVIDAAHIDIPEVIHSEFREFACLLVS